MKTVKVLTYEKYIDIRKTANTTEVIINGSTTRQFLLLYLFGFWILLGAFIGAIVNDIYWPGSLAGFNLPATIGGILGFLLTIKLHVLKKARLTFSSKGVGYKRRLYPWEHFKGFYTMDNFRVHESGYQEHMLGSLAFNYGLKAISIPVGWTGFEVAGSISSDLNALAKEYQSV